MELQELPGRGLSAELLFWGDTFSTSRCEAKCQPGFNPRHPGFGVVTLDKSHPQGHSVSMGRAGKIHTQRSCLTCFFPQFFIIPTDFVGNTNCSGWSKAWGLLGGSLEILHFLKVKIQL